MWWDPLPASGGYHGYWARDLKKVDEHLGTLDTYKALSGALHRARHVPDPGRGAEPHGELLPVEPTTRLRPGHTTPAASPVGHPGCDVTQGFVQHSAAVPTTEPERPPSTSDDATDPAQRAAAIYHWTPGHRRLQRTPARR